MNDKNNYKIVTKNMELQEGMIFSIECDNMNFEVSIVKIEIEKKDTMKTYFQLQLFDGEGFSEKTQHINGLRKFLIDKEGLLIPNFGFSDTIIKPFGEQAIKEAERTGFLSQMGKQNPYIHKREAELKALERAMIQFKKPNAILVGGAGTGKTAIVEKLAWNISQGNCCHVLQDYVIMELSATASIAGTKHRGEFEEKINDMINMVKNKKVILFIDEIHMTMGLGTGTDTHDGLNNILKPYLARGIVKVIGATTTEEFKIIMQDSAYKRRFKEIKVEEPSTNDTIEILNNSLTPYIGHYDIKVTSSQIKEIVEASEEVGGFNPDKSFTILEDAMSNALMDGVKKLRKKDIEDSLSNYHYEDDKAKSVGFCFA